jgi:tetratricopeptide (TPR) repeat protein
MSKGKSTIKSPNNSKTILSNDNSSLWIRISLCVVAILIYGSTVGFKFTLDDDIFYLKHTSVQKGLSGFGEFFSYGSMNKFDGTTGIQPYRPATLLSFAIEKQFFNNSASISHFINLLLYILIINFLYVLLKRIFPKFNFSVLAAIALIYTVHPIHTEVVCSVKSRDELLAALFGLLAWLKFTPKNDSNSIDQNSMITGTFFFLIALLSKESAITFMAIIPLSYIMLFNIEIKNAISKSIPLFATTALFLFVRFVVVGNEKPNAGILLLENVLNGAQNFNQVTATKMEILYYYFKLLFIPWPLNWDYSFNQIPIVEWNAILPIISIIIYGGLAIFAILYFRKKPVLSFSILFFFITSAPTNNLFFNNGATIGERFLFIPSLGFAIAISVLLATILKFEMIGNSSKNLNLFRGSIIAVSLIFGGLSIVRSSDWRDNLTLFTRGVEISPNSSRTHYSLASESLALAQQETDQQRRLTYLNKAVEHFKTSLTIFPDNFQALYNSGICYSVIGDTLNAISYYKQTIDLNKTYVTAMNNLGVLYQAQEKFDSAFTYYNMAFKINPNAPIAKSNLANLFFSSGLVKSRQGKVDDALTAYKLSLSYDGSNVMSLNNIASIYSNRQIYDSALVYLKQGFANDNTNLMILENIAAVSYFNKNYNQAIEFANKALAINNRLRKSVGVLADSYRALGNVQEANKYQLMLQQPN